MSARIEWSRDEVLRRVVINEGGCWIWQRSINSSGYGRLAQGKKRVEAHRFIYELLVGPIPDGLTIDHVCHTDDHMCPGGLACWHRACVNPDHLEPVTQHENVLRAARRKTSCPQNHPYEGWNLIVDDRGRRACRTCIKERTQEWERRTGYVKPAYPHTPRRPCNVCGQTTTSKKSICRTCWRQMRSAA